MTHSIAKTAAAALIATAFPFAAVAQNNNTGNSPAAPNMYERNVYQQQRIEQGLKDGSLTVQEAANLERGQARVDRMESRALADGKLTDTEKTRINDAQNRQSAAIDRERGDHQRGDPNSRSAQRMQEDVQRNVNEQRRIAQGVQSGQITNREASRLERGASRIFRQEARAGADGRIDRNEQRHIQGAQNHQSQAIYRERHDGQTRGQAHGWHHAGAAQRPDGNHFGQLNQASGAASGTSTANAQPAPRTHTNNGNHFGQVNRAPTVAQNSNGRGNRR